MAISYRDGGMADAPLLQALFRESFTDTFGHLYCEEDLRVFLDAIDVAAWEAEIADPAYRIRIAEENKKPAGFAKVGPLSVPLDPPGRPIELRQLYILPPWKGRGIAAALMEWALGQAAAQGADHIYLSVYSQNDRAKRFYSRYGFEEVGAYHFMVGNQADDERIMRLRLENDGGG
jgi:ribosomal protein S18 acetylase RimI-like enzyme